MKKLFSSKKVIFLAIIFLFIVGQIMGTVAIRAFFINYKIKELSPQLTYISGEIGDGKSILSKNNDFIIKAYDIYGAEMNIFNQEKIHGIKMPEGDISNALISYLPKVIAGKKVATLTRIKGHPSESIVIGAPIIKNDIVIGGAFLLKPASDFAAVLMGFYLVFLVSMIAGTIFISIFIYLYLQEMKLIEQTRRDYIANISHELKSPIASIKALTETLADKVVEDEETKDKYYSIILKESSRLQKLIFDMLELSRLQSQKDVFQKENINTKDLMQEVYDKYFALVDDMDIIFEVTKSARNASDVYSCKDRLLQLFNILIDNAVKFVGEDGKIIIDVTEHHDHITICVKDNGVGIEKSVLPYVFDRYYKEDKAHNTKGSGLGLSIAQEIMTGLGERITVSSEFGKGTQFYFTVKKA